MRISFLSGVPIAGGLIDTCALLFIWNKRKLLLQVKMSVSHQVNISVTGLTD